MESSESTNKMVQCAECKVTFTKTFSLRAHVKRKHPENSTIHIEKLDSLAPKTKAKHGTHKCPECNSTFVNFGNLKAHMKVKHPEKLAEFANRHTKKCFNCKQCNAKFTILKQLTLHKRNQHALVRKMLRCPLCQYTGARSKHLIAHYRTEHSLAVETEILTFETFDKFQEWKTSIEKQMFSSFVNMHGFNQAVNCKKVKYTCHRSGDIRRRGIRNNIRSLKTQGSNKINAYCPAEMSVIVEETKCVVHFCKTHVGHKLEEDMGHLFLSLSDRQNIASKIAGKVPFQSILDDIRDSVSNCHLERTHLLTKKDLFNIEKAFHLNETSVRHANDAVSVDAWVNELKLSNSVLFYKSQGCVFNEHPELKVEDFLLIIMTEGQKELLLRFGEDCICVDGTHGLNGYGFELHTILTLDDLREGYPTAFFISNRSDAEALKIFFSYVEENIGTKIKPRVFMSDMAEAYYNAWVQIMHPAEFRLYCTWHVDKAWRKNLEKVVGKEKRVLVYHMLRMLLQERDVATFNKLIQKFLSYCNESPDTLDFANYFQQNYANKADHWAYCHRLHSGLNTNMHIERMHRTIKHLYLHGKHVKRLDKAISAILKFVRDKIFERLIIMHKGKVCTKLSDLRQRHKTSESLDLGKVVQLDVGWMVPSTSSKEIYIVEELQSVCTCRLMCTECGVCIHRYTCTCLDCSIKWNMCKHIHLVCKHIQQNASSLCTEADEVLSDILILDENEVGKMEETKNLVKAVSTNKTTSQVVCETQQKMVEKLQRLIYGSHTLEELEAIERIISPIEPTLEAVRSNQVFKSHRLSTASSAAIPANKKIEPQRRLFKTKKKRKATALVTPLLSAEETDTLALQLILHNGN